MPLSQSHGRCECFMADRCCSKVRKPAQDIARRSEKHHVSYHMPRSTPAIAVTLPNRAESLARHLDSEIQLEILAFSPAFPELLSGVCIDHGGASGGGCRMCQRLYGQTSMRSLHLPRMARFKCMRGNFRELQFNICCRIVQPRGPSRISSRISGANRTIAPIAPPPLRAASSAKRQSSSVVPSVIPPVRLVRRDPAVCGPRRVQRRLEKASWLSRTPACPPRVRFAGYIYP
jgi:hypothetical protein